MTEVRVRQEFGTQAARLGDVPLDRVDEVIPMLDKWGGVSIDGEVHEKFCGQFALDTLRNQAYFEVIAVEDSDL